MGVLLFFSPSARYSYRGKSSSALPFPVHSTWTWFTELTNSRQELCNWQPHLPIPDARSRHHISYARQVLKPSLRHITPLLRNFQGILATLQHKGLHVLVTLVVKSAIASHSDWSHNSPGDWQQKPLPVEVFTSRAASIGNHIMQNQEELTHIVSAKVPVPGLVTRGKGKSLTSFPEIVFPTASSSTVICCKRFKSFVEPSAAPQCLGLLLLHHTWLQKSHLSFSTSPRRSLAWNYSLQPL